MRRSISDRPRNTGEEYRGPNRFSGRIEKVVLDTQPADLTAADQQKLRAAAIVME